VFPRSAYENWNVHQHLGDLKLVKKAAEITAPSPTSKSSSASPRSRASTSQVAGDGRHGYAGRHGPIPRRAIGEATGNVSGWKHKNLERRLIHSIPRQPSRQFKTWCRLSGGTPDLMAGKDQHTKLAPERRRYRGRVRAPAGDLPASSSRPKRRSVRIDQPLLQDFEYG